MHDVARNADELGDVQREYLTTKAQWRRISLLMPECWMTHPPEDVHNELKARRLVNWSGMLTPLGLAVRDYLLHRPTIDASTDRNQAKVVRCGKGIE